MSPRFAAAAKVALNGRIPTYIQRVSAASPTEPVNRRHDIAAHIRAEIFIGHLSPGTKIDQDVVASEVGASRIPVREALVILEREGLVSWSPNRGTFVADLTEADIRDHFALLGAMGAIIHDRMAQVEPDARAQVDAAVGALFRVRSESMALRRTRELREALLAAGVSHRLVDEFTRLTESLPVWRFAGRADDGRRRRMGSERYFAALGERVVRHLRASGFWKPEHER
jgi:DNA-binding GntR family transcriptional regulator